MISLWKNKWTRKKIFTLAKNVEINVYKYYNNPILDKSIRKFYLYDPPKILTISLKRFKQKSYGGYEKNDIHIDFPEILNLDKYTLIKREGIITDE